MKIVGVGVGPGMLTEQAIKTIRKARRVYGSRRAIELAGDYIQGESHVLTDYTPENLNDLPGDSVLLSTGDPMLSGLGGIASGEVIPGVSSLQVACARLQIPLTETIAITVHGREKNWQSVSNALEAAYNVFVLPDPDLDLEEFGGYLLEEGYRADLYVLERLGYPDERVVRGSLENPPGVTSDLYCIMIERIL